MRKGLSTADKGVTDEGPKRKFLSEENCKNDDAEHRETMVPRNDTRLRFMLLRIPRQRSGLHPGDEVQLPQHDYYPRETRRWPLYWAARVLYIRHDSRPPLSEMPGNSGQTIGMTPHAVYEPAV